MVLLWSINLSIWRYQSCYIQYEPYHLYFHMSLWFWNGCDAQYLLYASWSLEFVVNYKPQFTYIISHLCFVIDRWSVLAVLTVNTDLEGLHQICLHCFFMVELFILECRYAFAPWSLLSRKLFIHIISFLCICHFQRQQTVRSSIRLVKQSDSVPNSEL